MGDRLRTLVKRRGLLSLLAREVQSQDELATELERSKRTISRYLRELEQVGVVRRRGSQADLTRLGRWYVDVLDTCWRFSLSVRPLVERAELSPDATPPHWVLSACDPISSSPRTPYSSVDELRDRLSEAESIRAIVVTLTPPLTDILSWEKTEVVLPDELRHHLPEEFDESNGNWTTVSNVELDVNLLVAETGGEYLTAFTFFTNDGTHAVLLTDDVDANCWANGWIDKRLVRAQAHDS